MISDAEIRQFQQDGAIVLRGLFDEWVDVMIAGVARNMADPGPYDSENAVNKGRFSMTIAPGNASRNMSESSAKASPHFSGPRDGGWATPARGLVSADLEPSTQGHGAYQALNLRPGQFM